MKYPPIYFAVDRASDVWHNRARVGLAQVAQSVEQGTENPRVGGSIPPLGTNLFLAKHCRFCPPSAQPRFVSKYVKLLCDQ